MSIILTIALVPLIIFLYLYIKYDYTEPTNLVKDIILYIKSLYYDLLGYPYIEVSSTDIYGYEVGDDIVIKDNSNSKYYTIVLIAPLAQNRKKIYLKLKQTEHDLVY